MKKPTFPQGWNEDRVKRLIAHYDQMDEDAMVAEDEAAEETKDQTLMMVPTDLVPAVRELIARGVDAS
jgi:hypothetical protein